jgi:ribosomal RNA-processing protein 36
MQVASDSESDYDTSSDNDDNNELEPSYPSQGSASAAAPARRLATKPYESDDDDMADNSEDDDDHSIDQQDEDEDSGNESNNVDGAESDDDSTDGSQQSTRRDDDVDESQLPLAQRIQRQDEQGVDLQSRRKRKLEAIKIATERLHASKLKKMANSTKKSPSDKKPLEKPHKSKHAPTEASSKRSDFYKRRPDLNESGIGVDLNAHRYKPRDPRVNNLNGHLDLEHFGTNFAFLSDMRQKEITLYKKRIAARKKTGPAGQERRRRMGIDTTTTTLDDDQATLKQLLHEKAELERRRVERAVERSVKAKIVAASGGNRHYIPKRPELKRLQIEAKYEELHKRGGDKAVDRALAKRRKKNKSRDSAKLGDRA